MSGWQRQAVSLVQSRTVVLPASDVDTDQIIPARFLKGTVRDGLGRGLFADWRYDPSGAVRPEFVLNRPEARGAEVLVAGHNFGCGSSREHAVWALMDYGFAAVLSPRFADIFRNNSGKMGLVAATVPEDAVHRLWEAIEEDPQLEIVVDVEHKRVAAPSIGLDVAFEIDDFTQYRLLNGLDDIGLSLRHADAIESYEAKRPAWLPAIREA
jgi:3-isopropylmalate/(R)-2-methylmalate dehydratase small subunit